MNALRCSRSQISTFGIIATLLVLLCGFGAMVEAQDYTTAIGTPSFTTAEPVELGFIDVPNGNLHIEIPLVSLPQRGSLSYNARLVYDSRIWQIVSGTSLTWQPTNVANSMAGWRLVTGAETGAVTSHVFTRRCDDMVQYTVYSFTWTDPNGTGHDFFPGTTRDKSSACQFDQPSGDSFAIDSSGYHIYVTNYYRATVYAPDGTQVYPTVQDTNGNYFTTDANGNIVDTVGRTPLKVTNNADGTITYAVLNPSGGYSNYTLTKQPMNVSTSFGQSGVTESTTAITGVQKLTLPDNTSYSFTYDSGLTPGYYGELATVTLPTGVVINYNYTTFADGYGMRNRWISGRSVSAITGSWTYTPQVLTICPQGSTGCTQKVTVTRPNGDQTVYTDFLNNGAWVSRIQHLGTNGPITIDQTWDTSLSCGSSCSGTGYIRKTGVITSIPSGSNVTTKATTYNVDPNTGLTSETDEYDYGTDGALGSTVHGALLRQTTTTYALYNRPYQVTVIDGPSGSTVAQTTYSYDQSAVTASGATQLHSPTMGRGNPTTIAKMISQGATLSTQISYYDTGLPNKVTEPNSATTAYTYGSCNGSLADSIALPIGTPKYTWNCSCAVMLSSTDVNNQTTSYSYGDTNYCRPTKTTYPDGGSVGAQYSLTASPFNVVTTTAIDANTNYVTTTYYDGLGRVEHAETPGSSGTVYVAYTYDSLSRPSRVTNPHYSTTSSSDGTVTYGYDVLGRVIQITYPDGNTETTTISRNSVVRADQTGRKRQLTNDGLGRLTSVLEPDAVTGVLGTATTYTYNALDKLLTVTQAGPRTRAFSYDGLGRLLSEQHPEVNGTITFTYDSVTASTSKGDLVQVVSPAPNQTGTATVTKTYTYDAAHRLTGALYSDGTTPAVVLKYDQTAAGGHPLTNSLGRLTTKCAGTVCSYSSYDTMGRLRDIWQYSTSQSVHYDYNFAGLPTHYTNGVGVDFYPSFNAAEQVVSVTSGLVDGSHPRVLASGLAYGPTGGLTAFQYGVRNDTGTGLVETRTFNPRLQPLQFTVTDPTTQSNVLTQAFSFADTNGKNNGNLISYAATGAQIFSRAYSYDQLNRLVGMTGDCSMTWAYDVWGNRLSQNGGAPCTNGAEVGSVNSRNQLTGITYDSAGNMTAVPQGASNVSLTYDAENRIVWVGSPNQNNSVNYIYDASGQRVQKSTYGTSAITKYVFDGAGQVVAELDGGGTWQAGYVYVAGRLSAVYKNGTVYFTHSDHLTSTRLWSTIDRAKYMQFDYQPFGEALSRTPINEFLFVGKEHDLESATEHFLFRDYPSSLGRWAQVDPGGMAVLDVTNPQTLNLYSYVLNSPCVYVDPLGLSGTSKCVMTLSVYDNGRPVDPGKGVFDTINKAFSPASVQIDYAKTGGDMTANYNQILADNGKISLGQLGDNNTILLNNGALLLRASEQSHGGGDDLTGKLNNYAVGFVLAHEMGHILTECVHGPGPFSCGSTGLMAPGPEQGNAAFDPASAAKTLALTPSQIKAITAACNKKKAQNAGLQLIPDFFALDVMDWYADWLINHMVSYCVYNCTTPWFSGRIIDWSPIPEPKVEP